MSNLKLDIFDDELDIFYLCFGLLRQSIWSVEPRMKDVMLRKF
jgi:hypothetical protein